MTFMLMVAASKYKNCTLCLHHMITKGSMCVHACENVCTCLTRMPVVFSTLYTVDDDVLMKIHAMEHLTKHADVTINL